MNGAAAGFSPAEVDAMSLWQFACAMEAFAAPPRAGSPAGPDMELTEEDLAELGVDGFNG